jgi:hypothetical protein
MLWGEVLRLASGSLRMPAGEAGHPWPASHPALDTSASSGKLSLSGIARENYRYREASPVAIHLTPTELADEVNMKRREVIYKCMEMGVPIFNGKIDKTLFISSLKSLKHEAPERAAA